MQEKLTPRQQTTFEIIQHLFQRKGFYPSIREIAQQLKTTSTTGVRKHLTELERKGYITKTKSISRGIQLAVSAMEREIPILGRVAAGLPTLAVENLIGTLKLNLAAAMLNNTFLLKVTGMSMRDAGILDGDYVLVKQQLTAENGEIIVALVNGEDVTLKRFRRKINAITLEPANPDFQPITIKKGVQLSIIGKVLLSFRDIEGNIFTNVSK